jgi:hypothetical protein
METKEDLIAALELCTHEETCALGYKILMENCEKVEKITGRYSGHRTKGEFLIFSRHRPRIMFTTEQSMDEDTYWIILNKEFIKLLKNE